MHLAYPGLFSWIEKKITVVVPSRLQAAVAYQQFTLEQLALGEDAWERPSLVSMGAWLTACWQEARYGSGDVPLLLSANQEQLLWKQIIDSETLDLFDASATASIAAKADRLGAEWFLAAEGPLWKDGSDAAEFQRWRRLLQQRCQREGWVTRSALLQVLPDWISEGRCAAGSFAFAVQGPLAPAFDKIVRALDGRAQVAAPQLESSGRPAVSGKYFAEVSEEFDHAARWARLRFEENRNASLAVFVPDLDTHRKAVQRAFQRVFYPGACRFLLTETSRDWPEQAAFQVNSSPTLSDRPAVAAALLPLELARPRMSIAAAGSILRSTWIEGAIAERSQRATADLQLKRLRELDVSLSGLEQASARCPLLVKLWPRVHRVLGRKKPLDSFSGWSRFLVELLQATGWPGEHRLTAAEQKDIESWKETLSRLSSLSLVSPPVPLETALAELQLALAHPDDHPELAAPVQVLDATQAEGLQFDAALVTGLSDETWPPPFSGSPFLPLKLQREQGVPSSSPKSLRAERQQLTSALFRSAPAVSATWAGRMAPIARSFVNSHLEDQPIWTEKTAWQSFKPAVLEEQDDSQGPRFIPAASTRGGTSVIRAQSLCPFRAFAEFRLHGASPDEGCLGLDARERGGNLHKALELVWQQLRTRDNLRATPYLQLEGLVKAACDEAVTHDRTTKFGQVVASVEVERLQNVILEWLAIEKDRAHDFTVETVEEENYFDLAGLRLRLRLDRIDRLANGQVLLVDYKSGDQKRAKLQSPRPQEPQLLVYAAALSGQVDGILFAQLKARDVRPVGITRERHFKSKTVDIKGSSWEAFLEDSTLEVERMAAQFQAGYAARDPLKGACDFCAQKALCRIAEAQGGEQGEE